MADIPWSVATGSIALTSSLKTILQIAAATNVRLRIDRITLGLTSTDSASNRVYVKIAKQTNAGTATAVTPVKRGDAGGETLQFTASKDATVEPTTTDTIWEGTLDPTQTQVPPVFPLYVPGGTRVAVLASSGAGLPPNVYGTGIGVE